MPRRKKPVPATRRVRILENQVEVLRAEVVFERQWGRKHETRADDAEKKAATYALAATDLFMVVSKLCREYPELRDRADVDGVLVGWLRRF